MATPQTILPPQHGVKTLVKSCIRTKNTVVSSHTLASQSIVSFADEAHQIVYSAIPPSIKSYFDNADDHYDNDNW
jgi:hypothetical protein